MLARSIFAGSLLATLAMLLVGPAAAQTTPSRTTKGGWRTPLAASAKKVTPVSGTVDDGIAPRGAKAPARRSVARVTKGTGKLPNAHGQVWREYDITPYTLRVTATKKPEQAIIDWILRETGYEMWHSQPLGILSADKRTLKVYHTPDVQEVVADVVDRFVSSEAENQAFSLRVLSVGNPNWRAAAKKHLQPISVESPGVQAWLAPKEDAALLMALLRKRTDFREHGSPHLLVNNGQSTILSAWRTRQYVKDVLLKRDPRPHYEPEMAAIEEGFSLEFTPLVSLDGRHIEAVLKCNIDQIEKMVPVLVDLPLGGNQSQRYKIAVPQMTNARMHERFRWPIDKVLVISRGVVATPVPGQKTNTNPLQIPSFTTTPPRADAVVMIQNKGKVDSTEVRSRLGRRSPSNYRGRY